ncbi:O-antigen polysaccharide polymerase Wzy family protein [Mediterraneibacter sp. ICN-202921]|uniref:O-antigen polysaccharide polymerase Wzy family protein n=1 Tax=Mediterraneibacter sp. ICN-202921 TaxID=3134657 RepID=UPI0030BE89A2
MKKCIRYIFVLLFIFTGIAGIYLKDYNVFLVSAMSIWIANVIFSFENLQRRIYFLMFEITFFVFLLSRPFISFCEGKVWWKLYETEHVKFSLVIILLSQIGLMIGTWFIEEKSKAKKVPSTLGYKKSNEKKELINNIQIISLLLFYVSGIFFFIQEGEKLLATWQKGYLAYYTSFEAQLPFWIYTLASFMKVSFCVYLATWPKKKNAILPIGIFLCSALPSLIIGLRNPIMLNAVFVFLYFVVRHILDQEEKWIGKIEKYAFIVGIPCSLIFMTLYSYIRSGLQVGKQGILRLLIGFFYGQGVTFDVLAIGHKCIPLLPEREIRNYTFGEILDYFLHGSIAQKMFGAEVLDSGNTVKNALESNSLAHNMSYIDMGKEYLEGHGWGSSYLLEVFIDYGYIGVLLFNIILGILLIYAIDFLKKNILCCTIVFMCLQSVFFIPRAEATGWLSFLFTIQFWLAIIAIYLAALLCVKRYSMRKEK